MIDNQILFFNKLAEKLTLLYKKLIKNNKENFLYIHDQYKIVIIKFSQLLVPKGIKINEKVFSKLSEDNLKKLIEILMKKYSIEIFNYFDQLAQDLYNMFESIKKEIPDELLADIQDSAIKNIIINNLVAVSVSSHSIQNFIAVKTNGTLENFQVFLLDEQIKTPQVFKREILSLFTDFYLNYLMILRQQKKVIINQLSK
ncbi:MAG: hypothetical protein PHV30_11615 [Candidatus Margulisbacteria bacterium]|nr:hypothetical protein [Candidatus Margulisiibacteriota bacterium]